MTFVWLLLGGFALLALMLLGVLRVAKRWAREGLELQECGIETTGVVVERVEVRSSRHIRYEYSDQFGGRHRRKVLVTPDAWDQHVENGPITIVYSERDPSISAPKYLLDLARSRRA